MLLSLVTSVLNTLYPTVKERKKERRIFILDAKPTTKGVSQQKHPSWHEGRKKENGGVSARFGLAGT